MADQANKIFFLARLPQAGDLPKTRPFTTEARDKGEL